MQWHVWHAWEMIFHYYSKYSFHSASTVSSRISKDSVLHHVLSSSQSAGAFQAGGQFQKVSERQGKGAGSPLNVCASRNVSCLFPDPWGRVRSDSVQHHRQRRNSPQRLWRLNRLLCDSRRHIINSTNEYGQLSDTRNIRALINCNRKCHKWLHFAFESKSVKKSCLTRVINLVKASRFSFRTHGFRSNFNQLTTQEFNCMNPCSPLSVLDWTFWAFTSLPLHCASTQDTVVAVCGCESMPSAETFYFRFVLSYRHCTECLWSTHLPLLSRAVSLWVGKLKAS